MSSTTIGTLALIGAGFIIFGLINVVTGRISYVEDETRRKTIRRSDSPTTFWLVNGALLAAGAIFVAAAGFFYLR